ncbi:trypsin-like peptidase domain-containing protein [Gordonia sp. NPDC003425]
MADDDTTSPDNTTTPDNSPFSRENAARTGGTVSQVDSHDAAPRHAPVSPSTAQVFGRPAGVDGSFANAPGETRGPQPQIAPPDPVLAEAFGRPEGTTDTLQRDPLATFGVDEQPASSPDPWRDPESPASLDTPALAPPTREAPTVAGPKLSVKDVLFGNKIAWHALASLAVIALLIGVVGGLVGRYTAEVAAPLNSDTVTLSTGGSDSGDQPRSAVAKVAQAVEKSVVSVDVRTASAYGTGSGFVIDKAGYILTNNHVISMAANDTSAKLEVVFFDRQRVPARIVGRDIRTDLAVLKVDNVDNLTVAKIGNSDDLQIGEEVVAFGSPLGLDRTVTSGIISATHRAVPLAPDADSDTDAVIDAIQTDASINPGNSGGPLVNESAAVIGINTAIASGAGGSVGLGFAIPINQAIPIAQTLIRDGKVNHPQIGVSASSVRNDRVLGAQIRNVVDGGPAAAAGVREGDVITSFNGRTIESADELTVAVRTTKIGQQVPFTYWRDGRTFNGTMTTASD